VFGGDPRFVGLECPKQQDAAKARDAIGLCAGIMPHE